MRVANPKSLGDWPIHSGSETKRSTKEEHGLPGSFRFQGGHVLHAGFSPEEAKRGWLGPPAIGALSHPFFGWEGSPTKIDNRKSWHPDSNIFQALKSGGPRWIDLLPDAVGEATEATRNFLAAAETPVTRSPLKSGPMVSCRLPLIQKGHGYGFLGLSQTRPSGLGCSSCSWKGSPGSNSKHFLF